MIRVHSPLSTKFSTFLFSRKLNFIIEVTIDCIAKNILKYLEERLVTQLQVAVVYEQLTTVLSLMHAKALFEV